MDVVIRPEDIDIVDVKDGKMTGEVESVLFKGVHIGKGAKVSNCVIMQDTVIGAGSNLSYVIADKDVVIKDNRSLMGFLTYPVYINKASTV